MRAAARHQNHSPGLAWQVRYRQVWKLTIVLGAVAERPRAPFVILRRLPPTTSVAR